MSDYLPKKDNDLKEFALNFASLVSATPNTYGLVAGDATQIDTAAQDFATKYSAALAPTTRTKASIIAKDNAKSELVAILRGYAMQIKNNRAVTAEAKANLRLTVNDFIRTPVTAPLTRPQITIAGVDARQHELRFADILTPDSRVKPAGVEGLQVFCQVGEAPPADPSASRFHALVTRQPLTISFQLGDVGKTAWYYARWYTRTGLVGPFSQVASMTVAG